MCTENQPIKYAVEAPGSSIDRESESLGGGPEFETEAGHLVSEFGFYLNSLIGRALHFADHTAPNHL